MELREAVIAPVAVGAVLYIMDMLLPEGRLARVAMAVAGIVAMHALLAPVLAWLGGADTAAVEGAYISAQQVLTGSEYVYETASD